MVNERKSPPKERGQGLSLEFAVRSPANCIARGTVDLVAVVVVGGFLKRKKKKNGIITMINLRAS